MVSVFDIIQNDGNDGEGKDRKAKKMQTARVEEIHVSRCTGDVRLLPVSFLAMPCSRKGKIRKIESYRRHRFPSVLRLVKDMGIGHGFC
jgi:hypothetical protein